MSIDSEGIDFMELVNAPVPAGDWVGFNERVAAVVRALHGLDRRAIHDVLKRAGKIARESGMIDHEAEGPR
jgi:hypothetical protein